MYVYNATRNSIVFFQLIIADDFIATTEAHIDWLVSVEGDKADLSKKPTDNGVPTDIGDYGVEGTFRKINLD